MHRLLVIGLAAIGLMGGVAEAIHPYQLLRQTRPEKLDLSKVVQTRSGSLSAKYVANTAPIPLNKIHRWTLFLHDRSGAPITGAEVVMAGDMPEHLHGMTTKPVVSVGEKAGEYLAQGMNFHMPGWWEITLDISTETSRDLVRFQLIVGEDDGKPCPKCVE